MVGGQTTEPGHPPSTDERDSPAQPGCSSSPLKCTSHLGFSLGGKHPIPRTLRVPPDPPSRLARNGASRRASRRLPRLRRESTKTHHGRHRPALLQRRKHRQPGPGRRLEAGGGLSHAQRDSHPSRTIQPPGIPGLAALDSGGADQKAAGSPEGGFAPARHHKTLTPAKTAW